MQIDTFLAQVVAERRHKQARSRNPICLPEGFTLHADLQLAVRNRWFISPVFAQALFPPRAAIVGVPESDPDQISYWASLYGETCNWALFPRPQQPILEICLPVARRSLEWLAYHDCWDWRRTLRFRAGSLWFAMLRAPGGEIRLRATRLPGLRLLYSDSSSILIPPSRIRGENSLECADLGAQPDEAPASLFEPASTGEQLDRDLIPAP